MKTISVRDTIRFGWETFKKRPWFFIGVVLLVMVLSGILNELSPEKPSSLFQFLVAIAIFVLNFFIEIGLIAFALKTNDDASKVTVRDLWHTENFWKFVGTRILTIIIVLVGLVLLIVPGIIAALALMFATYVVVDRGLGPIEAIKESVRLTKGHRWELFLLALALIGLNILGALALLVGLLVTIPVSLFAIAHTYRKLVAKVA